MTLEGVIRFIGASHLLQPLLTPVLSRILGFGGAFSALAPVPRQIANNMAFASVALPTSLGILMAHHAHDIVAAGPTRSLAWIIAAFWSWRLGRQCVFGGLWPKTTPSTRWCHWMLVFTFAVQGPVLAAFLTLGSHLSRETTASFKDRAYSDVTHHELRPAPVDKR